MSFGGCNCSCNDNKLRFFYKEKESAQLECFDFSFNHVGQSDNKTHCCFMECALLSNSAQAELPVCQHHFFNIPAKATGGALSVGDYLP